MKRLLYVAFLSCLTSVVVRAQDPAKTDADKYKVVFENERVRVLEYQDKPGDKTSLHQHPDSVVYALGPFKRKLTLGDGRTVMIDSRQGEVTWVDAQKHIGENVGATDTHVLIVEMKEPAKKTARPRSNARKRGSSR